VNLSGTIRSPDPRGSFRFDELEYGFLRFNDLNADVAREADTIILSGIAGSLNNGQVRGRAELGETNRLQLEGSVVAVDLSTLFPVGSWANRHVGGSLTGDLDLRGRLRQPDSYNGQVSGKVRGLVLDYFPQVEGIEKVARPEILKNPILIEPSEFSFPVRDGVLRVNDVNLKSDGLRLKTQGEVRFQGDLLLSMKLVLLDEAMKGFIQDVLGDLYRRVGIGGDGKKLTIPLRVKGPIQSPNISVNHSEVNTNFRKNVVESLLSRPVGKPVNELLDEILRSN
jgi:autotransporter translocation and assembly factor TamB